MAGVITDRAPSAYRVVPSRGRLGFVDRVRGLALVLMVVDHVAAFVMYRRPSEPVYDFLYGMRMTFTRPSMPLFMLVSGSLVAWRGGLSERSLLQGAGVAALFLLGVNTTQAGLGRPEILTPWVVGMVVLLVLLRLCGPLAGPAAAVGLGMVQVSAWELGGSYRGYQPGVVLALLATGYLVGPRVFGWGRRLPSVLGFVGRRPLLWYTAHLLVLVYLGVLMGRP